MYTVIITLHDGSTVNALRDTLEAAERYSRLCKRNGLSLHGRWLNPSHILKVDIDETAEDDTSPVVKTKPEPAGKSPVGERERITRAVRSTRIKRG